MMTSEVSQSQSDKYCTIPPTEESSQVHGSRKQNDGYQGLERGRQGCFMGVDLQDAKVLEICFTTM